MNSLLRLPGYRFVVCVAFLTLPIPLFADDSDQDNNNALNKPIETQIFKNLTEKAYTETMLKYKDLGWTPLSLNVHVANDIDFYDVLLGQFKDRAYFVEQHRMSQESFAEVNAANEAAGWRLNMREDYIHRGIPRIAGIWVYEATENPLQNVWEHLEMRDSGTSKDKLVALTNSLKHWMKDNNIPGLSIAISKDNQLVYSKGIGYLDLRKEKEVREKDTLFRIGSISKSLTAIAILKLVEDEKIKLDRPMMDYLHGLRPIPDQALIDQDMHKITVRDLLTHRTGIDAASTDAKIHHSRDTARMMKVAPPLNQVNLLRSIVALPLQENSDYDFNYSHANYLFLGRIIESTSGMSYENYVKRNLLKPLGIRSMKIGGGAESQRDKKEAVYYTQNGTHARSDFNLLGNQTPIQYSFNLQATDAANGWLATPKDLLKIADSLSTNAKKRIVSSKTIKAMFAPPIYKNVSANGYYALGWTVWPTSQRHPVSLTFHRGSGQPGCASMIKIRGDGVNYAFMMNCDTTREGKPACKELAMLLDELIPTVKSWD